MWNCRIIRLDRIFEVMLTFDKVNNHSDFCISYCPFFVRKEVILVGFYLDTLMLGL